MVIFELSDQVVDFRDEESIFGVSIWSDDEVCLVPDAADLGYLFQYTSLSCCEGGVDLALFEVGIDTCLKKGSEGKVQNGWGLTLNELPDLDPMLFLHVWVTKGSNEPTVLCYCSYFGRDGLEDFIAVPVFHLELRELA